MPRSLRWHLLLNSLLVSAIAIVAVGIVAYILVERNFRQQEVAYLRDRGQQIVVPIERTLRMGGGNLEIQQIATMGLLSERVRVRVLDSHGQILADSGSIDDLRSLTPTNDPSLSGMSLQLHLDDHGRLNGYQMRGSAFSIDSDLASGQGGVRGDAGDNSLLSFPWWPPADENTDMRVTYPLSANGRVVAYAEFSDGPAFGRILRQSIQQALIMGGVIALLAAGLVALVSARQLTRPLHHLGQAADEMASGNLEARAPASRLAEFDRLAQRFNSMAERLSGVIASLDADRHSLRRLIADASHELRTPLTALLTFNQLLIQDTPMDNQPARTYLDESGKQLVQLDRLSTSLLSLSRLESRLAGNNFQEDDFRKVVRHVVENQRPMCATRNQTLTLSLPEDPVVMSHDALALEQAITNLVVNASRYSPEGALIDVSLAVGDGGACVSVADNGPGIDPEDQPHIFERFFRGRNQESDGVGLGLAISREIARIHQGDIFYEEQETRGSLFRLCLPLSIVNGTE